MRTSCAARIVGNDGGFKPGSNPLPPMPIPLSTGVNGSVGKSGWYWLRTLTALVSCALAAPIIELACWRAKLIVDWISLLTAVGSSAIAVPV